MQTHLIYGKMSSLWKYVAYEEELKLEVKALQEKLQNYKILMNQKVEWKKIKRIIGMGVLSHLLKSIRIFDILKEMIDVNNAESRAKINEVFQES